MIDTVFDLCVQLLVYLANQLGLTYKAINVWIFVVLWPIFTVGLIGVVVFQAIKIRRLRRQIAS